MTKPHVIPRHRLAARPEFALTQNPQLLASLAFMAGTSPRRERQAVGRRFFLCLLTICIFLLTRRSDFGQTVSLTGTQSVAASVHFQILDQRSVSFGKHTITLNRVAPPVFPEPVATPAPTPLPQRYANYVFLTFFATVYDSKLTVLQWFYGENSLIAVSNLDFDYTSTLYGFPEGDTFYGLVVFHEDSSIKDADPQTAAWLRQAQAALPQPVPGYIVISGSAGTDTLQGLDALHVYFGAHKDALVQAYTQQQSQFAAEQLHLKLYPPVKPAEVINYWPIKSGVYPTQANQ